MVSVVVSGRNDDYDGNFDDRLIIALSHNMRNLPEAEYIFVEWNPIPDKKLVSQKLVENFGDRITCYVVDPKYNEQFCTIDGFLEYPAKNVGVRRASGDYVLCTNSDIIFYPEVVEAMKNPLDSNVVYRAVRQDIKLDYLDIEFPIPLDKILGENNSSPMDASGDFLMMHRNLWNESTGYCEDYPGQRLHKDSFLVYIMTEKLGKGVNNLGKITHWRHPSSWSTSKKRPRVGDVYWDFKLCGYEKNPVTWGLSLADEEEIDNGIIWLH